MVECRKVCWKREMGLVEENRKEEGRVGIGDSN